MRESKFVKILELLDGYERAAFRRWLHSPAHHHRADAQRLYAHLDNQLRDKHPDWSKESAWAACAETPCPLNDAHLRWLLNHLLRQLEDFLEYTEACAETWPRHARLWRVYQRLGLSQAADAQLERWETGLPPIETASGRALEGWYSLGAHRYAQASGESRQRMPNLQTWADQLDAWYAYQKLKQACAMLAQQAVAKTTYRWNWLEALVESLGRDPDFRQRFPLVAIYYHAYCSQTLSLEAGESHFEACRVGLRTLPDAEARDVLQICINYMIRKINQRPEESAMRTLLELYTIGLERRLLLDSTQHLHRFTFKNAIGLALRLRAFDWAAQLIEQHAPTLPPRYVPSYTAYAQGKSAFAQGLHAEALGLLQDVEYEDIFLSLDTKLMLLKIHYLLGQYEVLEAFLHSFKTFLTRKRKQLGYHFHNYQAMVQLMPRILQLPAKGARYRQRLAEKIAQTAGLTEKAWLLEQVKIVR